MGFQRGVKHYPKWLPGGLLELLGLLKASWSGLGGLLERSWAALGPEKTSLHRLLAGPRAPRRLVSNCLGAKWLPKKGPGGSQNWFHMRIKLKMGEPLKSQTLRRISLIFGVQGAPFLQSKMGPTSDPNRIFDAKAFRKPLGGLLERSLRPLEPKKVTLEASWSRLGALEIAS